MNGSSSNQKAIICVIQLSHATPRGILCARRRSKETLADDGMKALHKVIITGTGRSGTTFLVRLLTELGFDTGYDAGNLGGFVDERSHGGLERDLPRPQEFRDLRHVWRQPKHVIRDVLLGPRPTPYILKNPAFCDTLGPILAEGSLMVDHAYVPVRALDAAAMSRARIGGTNGALSGGLWKTDDPNNQKAVLAEMFCNLVHTLVVHEIPHTFLLFPRLVEDWKYTHRKLEFLAGDIAPSAFREVFERVADPSLVHQFAPHAPKPGLCKI